VVKEFRDFVLRGNVVDLAIAVVMGVAFAAVVTALVDNILMQVIAMIVGEPDFGGLTFTINDAVFGYGAVLNALITFASIAAVLFFFVVKPMNILLARMKREEAPPPAPPAPEMSPEAERFLAELTRIMKQLDPAN
jgi:large conductance mechanosensitive channel